MQFPSRRWHLWLLAALPLVGAVALGCVLALGPSSSKVTEANFEKLQEGMTYEQVNEILGADNLWNFESYCGLELMVQYRDQSGRAEITANFSNDSDRRHFRLKDKRLQKVPLTLGDLLHGWRIKVRRRLGL